MFGFLDLHQLVNLAAMAAGLFLASRLRTPRDHERAALVALLATDFTADLVARMPDKPWAQLVDEIVRAIFGSGASPTRNQGVVRRAVIAALAAQGIKKP